VIFVKLKKKKDFKMNNNKITLICLSLFILLVGCFNNENSKPIFSNNEELVLYFHQHGGYEYISDEDKAVYSKLDFDKEWSVSDKLISGPTSKYFKLEKHLYSLRVFKAKSSTSEEIVIETFFPKSLTLFYGLKFNNKDDVEKLDNLLSYYNSADFNNNDLEFKSSEKSYRINETGIYLDLNAHKKRQQNRRKISKLVKTINEELEIPDSFFLAGQKSSQNEFDTFLSQVVGVEEKLERLRTIKEKIQRLDPDYFTVLIDNDIKAFSKALIVNKTFIDLKQNLEFSDIEIAKSTRGKMSVFGGFTYKGKSKINAAYCLVKFLNESGEIIGQQEMSLASNLFEGMRGSVGFSIEDSYVASLAKSVILEPSRVLVF